LVICINNVVPTVTSIWDLQSMMNKDIFPMLKLLRMKFWLVFQLPKLFSNL